MDFFVDADGAAGGADNGTAGIDGTNGIDGEGGDFLSRAVKRFFGLDYLFPYQRLVVSNILEAFDALKSDDSGQTVNARVTDTAGNADSVHHLFSLLFRLRGKFLFAVQYHHSPNCKSRSAFTVGELHFSAPAIISRSAISVYPASPA
jgi:hypothetical protein